MLKEIFNVFSYCGKHVSIINDSVYDFFFENQTCSKFSLGRSSQKLLLEF